MFNLKKKQQTEVVRRTLVNVLRELEEGNQTCSGIWNVIKQYLQGKECDLHQMEASDRQNLSNSGPNRQPLIKLVFPIGQVFGHLTAA